MNDCPHCGGSGGGYAGGSEPACPHCGGSGSTTSDSEREYEAEDELCG